MTSRLVMVAGYGESGKGEFSKMLARHTDGRAMSSSEAASPFVWAQINEQLGGIYKNHLEAWEDRRNHRDLWKEAIQYLNARNPTALADEMFDRCGATIYDGIRDRREFDAICEAYRPLCVWINRPGAEPDEGNEITQEDCHLTVHNKYDLTGLSGDAFRLASFMYKER